MNKIAAVGGKDVVLIFKAAGIDIYFSEEYPDLKELLRELARGHAVIFVTEDVARPNAAVIEKYKNKAYPVIIPIPSATGTDGYGMENVNKDIEKAVGFIAV